MHRLRKHRFLLIATVTGGIVLSCGDDIASIETLDDNLQGSWRWVRTEGYWCPPGYCNPDSSGSSVVMSFARDIMTMRVNDSSVYQYEYRITREVGSDGTARTILSRMSPNGYLRFDAVFMTHPDTLILDDMSLHRSIEWYSRHN